MNLTHRQTEIENYLLGIKGPQKIVVRELRSLLLKADPTVRELLQRQTLTFRCQAKRKSLRKRDCLSIYQYKDCTLLIFPAAYRYKDEFDILEGKFKDGRKLISFADLKEFYEKKHSVLDLVKQWTALLEPADKN
jgi:hypothetical protein